MYAYGIREGVSFCRIGSRNIFLDVPNDRYFGLAADLDKRFTELVSGGTADEPILAALTAAGVLMPGGTKPIEACRRGPKPSSSLRATQRPRIRRASTTRLAYNALARRAIWTIRAKKRSLARNLDDLKHRRDAIKAIAEFDASLARIELAHVRSAVVWPTGGRCLASGMALLSDLIAHRIHGQLLFGVQLGPFAAHCWVEVDGVPVCQKRETVESFVPVMIL